MTKRMTDEELAEHRRQRDYTRERGTDGWAFPYAFMSRMHEKAVDELEAVLAENERLTDVLNTIQRLPTGHEGQGPLRPK
jgi:hypothetical protein